MRTAVQSKSGRTLLNKTNIVITWVDTEMIILNMMIPTGDECWLWLWWLRWWLWWLWWLKGNLVWMEWCCCDGWWGEILLEWVGRCRCGWYLIIPHLNLLDSSTAALTSPPHDSPSSSSSLLLCLLLFITYLRLWLIEILILSVDDDDLCVWFNSFVATCRRKQGCSDSIWTRRF